MWESWGICRDYRVYIGIIEYILGLYWENGKEDGNYHITGYIRSYIVLLCMG